MGGRGEGDIVRGEEGRCWCSVDSWNLEGLN